ncbi:MAG: succinate dehydrogenase assembly factor 2 [Gammaproteobacteria bacterium]|nr:succinate dehydrogenase assembly factor 2 [Gammaproteobacteria bacterium]MDE2346514.1 succinate dehydrogenase assembly factor 2 [Gammaproteobacteria bacterium]
MTEMSRLRWQCRRGTKELDVLLENYLNNRYSQALAAEQQAFADLLELPDPQLLAIIMGQISPANEQQRCVIDALRRTTGS